MPFEGFGNADDDRFFRIARLLEHRSRHGSSERCLLQRSPTTTQGGEHWEPAVPIRDPEHRRDPVAQPRRDLPWPQRAGAEIPKRGHRPGTPERARGRRQEAVGQELAG